VSLSRLFSASMLNQIFGTYRGSSNVCYEFTP
jgi:hypothetical protein